VIAIEIDEADPRWPFRSFGEQRQEVRAVPQAWLLPADADMTIKPTWSTSLVACFVLACGSSGQSTASPDGGKDAMANEDGSGGGDAASDGGPQQTPTHDCTPACGAGRFCEYPTSGGFGCMNGPDSGLCPAGCPGCPSLPPACSGLPSACGGIPSCGCLLATCGCGGGTCGIDADGIWVIHCLSC